MGKRSPVARVACIVLFSAFVLPLPAQEEDPCKSRIDSVTYSWKNDGNVTVLVHHNGVGSLVFNFRGETFTRSIILGSPHIVELNIACMLSAEKLTVTAPPKCGTDPANEDKDEITIAPFDMQPTLVATPGAGGLDDWNIGLSFNFPNSFPQRRVRAVLFPSGTVVKDFEFGWTQLNGSSQVDLNPNDESILLVEATACNTFTAIAAVAVGAGQNGCKCGDECPPLPECAGDPINTYSGNMRYEDVDPLPSSTFFPVRRVYDSRTSKSGWFGPRWFSMFDAHLSQSNEVNGRRYVTVETEEHSWLLFERVGATYRQIGPGSTPPATLVSLQDGSWIQTDANGRLSRIFNADGFPIAFRDVASGREVRLSWSGTRPTRVDDSWDNWALLVTADATAHRITSIAVENHPGLVWNYVYDLHLLRVDSPLGTWRTYQYALPDQPSEQWRLTVVRDGADNIIESHAYEPGSVGRAVSSYGPTGEIDSVQVNLPGRTADERKAIIHYTNGRTETHYRRLAGGMWRTVEIDGQCESCGNENRTVVLDAFGNAVRIQSADGYITMNEYDVSGNKLLATTTYLRPIDCDPATASNHCRLTTDELAALPARAYTSATVRTTYAYEDPNWPDRVTTTTTNSVANPNGTRREIVTYDAASGEVLTRSVIGWTGNPLHEETRTTSTALYGNGEGAAFAPGGAFASAWTSLPQPRFRKSVDGPLSGTGDTTRSVYYPVDPAVPATWRGRLAAARNAAGHTVRYEDYDVFGNATKVIDANGVITRFTYDAIGRLTSTITEGISGCDTTLDLLCATDIIAERAFTGAGPLQRSEQPGGGVTVHAYDQRGRMTTISRGPSPTDLRERIEHTYDALTGVRTMERYLAFQNGTWVEKRRTSFTYDVRQRLQTMQHADSSTVHYAYDVAGRLASVRDENHAAPNTLYTYDPAGRLLTVRQQLGGSFITTSYSYDHAGNLTSVVDPNGNRTQYTYDDFGAMLSQTSPVTGTTTYTYDAAGRLLTVRDANDATTTRTYDLLGRVTAATSVRGAQTEQVTWSYDTGAFGIGRIASMTDPTGSTQYQYDRRGLLLREQKTVEGTSFTTSFGYDVDGNRSRITYPSARIVQSTYDFAGRPITVAAGGTTLVSSALYLPFGPWTEIALGNGTTRRRTYDGRYAIQTNQLLGPSGIIASYAYEHDPAGNITAIDDVLDPAYNRELGYDDLHRLTTANSGASLWGTGSYSYDAMGNLLSATLGTKASTFAYSGTTPKLTGVTENGVLSPVTYDAAGNELTAGSMQSTYSPANHLATTGTYSYEYDGRGVRTITRLNTPAVASLAIAPVSVLGGETAEATVTLTAPAPAGGLRVRIATSSPFVDVPETVLVPTGSASATFNVSTTATAVDRNAAIRATHGLDALATLAIRSTCLFDRLELSSATATGGIPVAGTVFLVAPRADDQPVSLTSSNAAVAAVPSSITIPAGASSASFAVTTSAVASATSVTVTAAGCGTVSASLNVVPPVLDVVSVAPTRVIGGGPATLTATLTGPAPAGGIVVTTSSSDPSAASVPAQITIPAGATSGSAAVTSVIRNGAMSVVLSGTGGGQTRSSTLDIVPCGSAPAPPQYASGEVIWWDDAAPAGAQLFGDWNWDATVYASGTKAIVDRTIAGAHEQWFENATARLTPLGSDQLFVYALLDPCNPPREVMVGWAGGGYPRAYWGEDLFGHPRVRMGNLPPVGQWVRLEAPAYRLGINGESMNWMAMSAWDGRVWFDRAGKRTCDLPSSAPVLSFPAGEVVWFDDALPAGAQLHGSNWTWDTSVRASGTQSHVQPPAVGAAEHWFTNATPTITPGPQDELFVYAYIDPCNPPREIMIGWFDGSWEHRAYWGEDLLPHGAPGTGRFRIGDLPAATGWVKLSVPAATARLVGRTISGMAFSVYGGRVWFDRAGITPCVFPPPTMPTLGANDAVWVDDDIPAGAAVGGQWTWDTAQKALGTRSLVAGAWTGTHGAAFYGVSTPVSLAQTDKVFVYVLIDSCAPPREISVTFLRGDWSWVAFDWGESLLTDPATRTLMGPLPAQTGQWVRLEIPASVIGPPGVQLRGMGFGLYNGRVWFDAAGVSSGGSGGNASMMSSSMIAATQTESSLRRYSFYTPELQLLAETTLTTAATPTIAYEYVWFAGEPLAQIETATGTTHWYFNDHLGAPILTTSSTATIDWRVEREPYGEIADVRAGLDRHQPLALPGQEHDGTEDRAYNVFRWYRAGWGRYTQGDPIGYFVRENTFAYARGNSLRFSDRLGLFSIDESCKNCHPGFSPWQYQQEVTGWCANIDKEINDVALADCIKTKCQTGVIRCDDPDQLCHKNYGAYAPYGGSYVNVCLNNAPSKGGMPIGTAGAQIIHEFAHNCNWKHGQQKGNNLCNDGNYNCIPSDFWPKNDEGWD